MYKFRVGLLILCICSCGLFAAGQTTSSWRTEQVVHERGVDFSVPRSSVAHPLAFTENIGQWNEDVRFRVISGAMTVWICKDRLVYQLVHARQGALYSGKSRLQQHVQDLSNSDFDQMDTVDQFVVTTKFSGVNPSVRVIGSNKMQTKSSYFIGKDTTKWRSDISNYGTIEYTALYPGLNLRFDVAIDGKIKFEITANNPSDFDQFLLECEGTDSANVGQFGQFELLSECGTLVVHMTKSDNLRKEAEIKFSEIPRNSIFTSRDHFSNSDVSLVYYSEFGGSDADGITAVEIDQLGSAYFAGYTRSFDLPIINGYQTLYNSPGFDAFVAKLSPSGDEVLYSTYLGAEGLDAIYGMSVDNIGCVYVTGRTGSSGFPLLYPYQTDQPGDDAFVAKLSSTGDQLHFSSYVGGNGGDYGWDIAVDDLGVIYVTGDTWSLDFPVTNPIRPHQASNDVFVIKLSASGSSLLYSTLLGGNNQEIAHGIAIDEIGNAYVTGTTLSSDFPLTNPLQSVYHGGPSTDAFVTKLSTTDHTLIYSTYLGGDGDDFGAAITADVSGCAYVTGSTTSFNFPICSAFDPTRNSTDYEDVFVSKLSSTGDSLVFSTYLGGDVWNVGAGIAVDANQSVYVAGATASSNFPLLHPYQDENASGASVAFLSKLTRGGNALVFSTYLGVSNGGHDVQDLAVDSDGLVYVCGHTTSNVFVAKLKGPQGCGDADSDAIITISDAVFVINFIFAGGPPPLPYANGDANSDTYITISDAVFLINYIFSGGPAPCEFY